MAPSFFTTLATATSFLVSLSLASPLSIQSRAISSDVFAKLSRFEQFAAAAYCPSNNDDIGGGKKLTCSAGNCPSVEAANVTTVYEFQNSLATDVTGYIAVDTTNDLTVLAFRGSKSVRNFITDVKFPTVPADICDSCRVSAGFWISWVEARPGILATLQSTAAAYPSSKVVVVGHSLGGALATLAAADLKKRGTPADLYTYGAPRVGGTATSNFITNQGMGSISRVTHKNDPVPRLPPVALGFAHISPEYYITAANNVPPTPADITKYEGSFNLMGSTGSNPLQLDISAHGWYFNQIGACGGSDFEFKH